MPSSFSFLTKCLDVILIKGSFDVLDHQAGLSYLRVADHSDLDHNAVAIYNRGFQTRFSIRRKPNLKEGREE